MLGDKLRDMARTIYHGQGFVFIRGLDPAKYTSIDNIIVFNGITSYISAIRGCQDDYGNMLGKHTPPANEALNLASLARY